MTPVTPTLSDLLLLPMTLYILGCAIYLASILNARQAGSLSKYRWIGCAFIVIGLIVAWGPAWDAMNPSTGFIYRKMLTRKLAMVQMGTPFLGVFLCIAVAVIDVFTRKFVSSHYNN